VLLIASLAAAGLLAGWPQRAVIARLDISPAPPALLVGTVETPDPVRPLYDRRRGPGRYRLAPLTERR
jgi:hypothetical protein